MARRLPTVNFIDKPFTMPRRNYTANMLAGWAAEAAMVDTWAHSLRWWVWALFVMAFLYLSAPRRKPLPE